MATVGAPSGGTAGRVTPGRLKIYKNPMRDDGVFVGEDKPIHPERGIENLDGTPYYLAVPRGAWNIPVQLEHEFAEFIVKAWNACLSLNPSDPLAAAQHLEALVKALEAQMKRFAPGGIFEYYEIAKLLSRVTGKP